MEISKNLIYQACIKQHDEGDFGIYFPNLFSKDGWGEDDWDYPLAQGTTRLEAIKEAQKQLALYLAGVVADNEDLPLPTPIHSITLLDGMEIINIEIPSSLDTEEIKEHLKGRHWHISYYLEDNEDEIIEAIGYKNDEGEWDIYFDDYSEEEEKLFFDSSYEKDWAGNILLFTVHLRLEAQKKFDHFVENVILKLRTTDEWSEREKNRRDSRKYIKLDDILKHIDEKVEMGEMTESEAELLKMELATDTDNYFK